MVQGRARAARGGPDAPPAPARVLVAEAAPEERSRVESALSREGLAVSVAGDGPGAVAAAAAWRPQVVVVDVGLPGLGGLEVMARLRRDQEDLAVILLSRPSEEDERVLGLELGADDCVVLPVSPRELAARVRAVLRRRSGRPPSAPIMAGPLRIDVAERRVALHGEPVELTPKEFDLLAFLASAPDRVFTRSELLEQVWDSSAAWQDPATVTEHVRRIRLRIEADAARPRLLQTVRGVGYRFDPGGADPSTGPYTPLGSLAGSHPSTSTAIRRA
ncbi:MAG: response regulator transcription factor [Actinomycetota bacterium]